MIKTSLKVGAKMQGFIYKHNYNPKNNSSSLVDIDPIKQAHKSSEDKQVAG